MINYNKNKLINTTLDKYYETFSHMLDTSDYVPEQYNNKIGKYIFKNMKKSFKQIDKEDRKYQRAFKKKIKEREKIKKKSNVKPKKKCKLWLKIKALFAKLSNVFKKSKGQRTSKKRR